MPNARGYPLPRTGQVWKTRTPAQTSRDMYTVYEFIRRLSTPFEKWPAYQAGIIDKKGNLLVRVRDMTPQQQKAWSYFDEISVSIKQLLMRVPGIQPKLKTIVGTMMLMKECSELSHPTPEELEQEFFRIVEMMTAGAGNVAGIGIGPAGEPPVSRAKKRMMRMWRRSLPT